MTDQCGQHCNPRFSNGNCLDGYRCADHHCQDACCHGQ